MMIETKSYTKKYQKHTPSGFCYYIVYRGRNLQKAPVVHSGGNAAEEFCKHLEMETRDIYDKYFKNEVPLKMTRTNLDEFCRASVCHICEEDYLAIAALAVVMSKLKITVISRENIEERLIRSVI